ncbi:EamA family transporter RarD [Marivita sp. S2033]|uniref:EamA family transporter RarD n=1 Tax=Marivita sp. S2033 TaxID=3373187 RepID=UPI0039825845
MTDTRKGVLALVSACIAWGLSSIFYKALVGVDPAEVLAHRTLWSLFFFAGVLLVQGRISALWHAVSHRASLKIIVLAAVMISSNWFLFIWSIHSGRATEASLGYYIFPLVAVVFGRLMFGERLSNLQWVAVGLAVAAVLTLTVGLRIVPWIPLGLAASFGLYGVLKKRLDLGPVVSVTAEVFLLSPLALGWLLMLHLGQGGAFGDDLRQSLLLCASGVVTGAPLILFAYGARRLAMSTVGLLQYINPTLQFVVAVAIFGEPFSTIHLAAFSLIWTALALYSSSAVRQDKARRRARMVSEAEVAVSSSSSSEASAKP